MAVNTALLERVEGYSYIRVLTNNFLFSTDFKHINIQSPCPQLKVSCAPGVHVPQNRLPILPDLIRFALCNLKCFLWQY